MKIYGYIILAGMIVAAVVGAWRAVYMAGYNARDVEIRTDLQRQQNEAIQKGIDEWIALQPEAEKQIVVEEKIVEKVRVVEKKIPEIVERIVEVKPDCSDLGDDYAGLLSQQVAAANSSSVPDSDTPAELVDELPGTE